MTPAPSRSQSSVDGFCAKRIHAPSVEPVLKFSLSSTTIRMTSSGDLICTYPAGLRPRVLVPSIIPSTRPASSNFLSRNDAALRAERACRVSYPVFLCAAAIFALPSAVFGPVLRPPWNRHFADLLALSAGRRHCPPWRLLRAVHRLQIILPPAVDRVDSNTMKWPIQSLLINNLRVFS